MRPRPSRGGTLTGTDFLTLTGGSLGPSSTCVFTATLQVPGDAEPGFLVNNTTSDVVGTVGSLEVAGGSATASFEIEGITIRRVGAWMWHFGSDAWNPRYDNEHQKPLRHVTMWWLTLQRVPAAGDGGRHGDSHRTTSDAGREASPACAA